MIEKLIASLMARPSLSSVARDEFERLKAGGYLDQAELERLAKDLQSKLGGQAEAAKGTLQPLVQGIGQSLREALDIPSRREILELTQALRAAKEAAEGERPSGSSDAPAGE